MLVKIIIVLFMLVILYSLGSAMFYLVRNKDRSDNVVKALSWRIGLSIVLFVLLFVGYAMGWITPHSV
jgi:putative copper export protein